MLTHIGAKIRYEEWRPFLHIAAPEPGVAAAEVD